MEVEFGFYSGSDSADYSIRIRRKLEISTVCAYHTILFWGDFKIGRIFYFWKTRVYASRNDTRKQVLISLTFSRNLSYSFVLIIFL